MHYLYIPFVQKEQNEQLIEMASKWQAAVLQDPRGKTRPEILVHGSGAKRLSPVQPTDKLYVLAHGNPSEFGKTYVASLRTMNTPVISYETLADRIVTDALPKTHKVLKLYICSASGNTKVFAENFYCEMEQLGYKQIEVHYYEASVSVPYVWGDKQVHKAGMLENLPLNTITPAFRASEVRHKV